jgi:hypothetical protein
MKYNIIFDIYICNGKISRFMQCSGFGIDAIGTKLNRIEIMEELDEQI